MKRINYAVLSLVLLQCITSPANSLPASNTLAKVISLAESSDVTLRRLLHRKKSAVPSLPAPFRARFPRFYAEYSGNESYSSTTPYSLTHILSGGIEVQLTDRGTAWLEKQKQKRQYTQITLQIRERKNQLTSELLSLCAEILYSEQVLVHSSEMLDMYKNYLHIASQQFTDATISHHAYRELQLRYHTKKLEAAEEKLQLKSKYRKLEFYTHYRSNPGKSTGTQCREKLQAELPILYSGLIGNDLSSDPHFYCQKAKHNCSQVKNIELSCRRMHDQKKYKIRRLFPETAVYAQIDFAGPAFPPSSPALTFGLHISGGAGVFGFSSATTGKCSPSTYSQEPDTQVALDLSHQGEHTFRQIKQNISHIKEELHYSRAKAGMQAIRLFEELQNMKEVQNNLQERSKLKFKAFTLKKQQFEFGNVHLIDVIESRQRYTHSLLELYKMSCDCFLLEYSLLVHCGLEQYVPELLKTFSADTPPSIEALSSSCGKGENHALR